MRLLQRICGCNANDINVFFNLICFINDIKLSTNRIFPVHSVYTGNVMHLTVLIQSMIAAVVHVQMVLHICLHSQWLK